jgi:aldose 1-epimerase
MSRRNFFYAGAAMLACAVLLHLPMRAQVSTKVWGATPEGQPVKLFTLSDSVLRVRLTGFGARIVSVEAPARDGRMDDVVLGYNDLANYVSDPKDYFGAIVGRYGNRIHAGTFALEGKTYHVPLNNNGNALHGGPQGFSSREWVGRPVGNNKVEFTLVSPDGDMGFPGRLTAHVTYTLTGNRIRIDYEATTTKATVVNLTNHSYFNLAGQASGDVLEQKLRIDADSITPVDATLIPTGALESVQGTPFDFRTATAIGARIGAGSEQLKRAGGYDHNFVLTGPAGTLRAVAWAEDPASGRTLTVLTTEPGVQFYSGNFLNGSAKGFTGQPYQKHAGFCLETQHFPDSPNHPNFPSTVLRPGHTLHSSTVFEFGVAGKTM